MKVNQNVTISGKKYKADGRGWLSVLHEENDVFMKYLKKIYNGAKRYQSGYPCDSGLCYMKYAIADFDGDAKNELLIYLYTATDPDGRSNPYESRGYGFFDMFEADSSGKVTKNVYSGVRHQGTKFSECKLTCYNNGVIALKEKDFYGYYCMKSSGQEIVTWPLTTAEYNNEIKSLTGGKKISVTFKDFKASNLK